MIRSWVSGLLVMGLVVSASIARADEDFAVPPCSASYGNPPVALEVNNEQVLHWMRTTANQYRDRARVRGEVTEVYPDKNGHEHFAIRIGRKDTDTIEIIYNQDFGAVPLVQEGMIVEACGDYITSTAPSGPYPASPDGAIVHWVHRNPKNQGHPHGYLMLDGVLYGADTSNAGPKPPHGGRRRR